MILVLIGNLLFRGGTRDTLAILPKRFEGGRLPNQFPPPFLELGERFLTVVRADREGTCTPHPTIEGTRLDGVGANFVMWIVHIDSIFAMSLRSCSKNLAGLPELASITSTRRYFDSKDPHVLITRSFLSFQPEYFSSTTTRSPKLYFIILYWVE